MNSNNYSRTDADFLMDARLFILAIDAFRALADALGTTSGADSAQRLLDTARRGLAADATGSCGAAKDVMANVARDLADEIASDPRAARLTADAARLDQVPVAMRAGESEFEDSIDIPPFHGAGAIILKFPEPSVGGWMPAVLWRMRIRRQRRRKKAR